MASKNIANASNASEKMHIVTSTATFTSTATINTTANLIMSSQSSGLFSPRPFERSTRSSSGSHVKSTFMRVRCSPPDIMHPESFEQVQSPVISPTDLEVNSNLVSVTPVNRAKTLDGSESSNVDLLRRVSDMEYQIQHQSLYNMNQNDKIQQLEQKINSLEGQLMILNSHFSVRDHVIEGLKGEISRLQQYTRRYSVSVTGLEKKPNEKQEYLREMVMELVDQVTSTTTENDIDKFHRNGRVTNNGKDQEILIRFKSHSAKEAFYRGRKTLPPTFNNGWKVKIRPSLSANQENLLKEAKSTVEEYNLCDENRNPVDFVFANIHGETQVKFKNKFRGSEFVTFRSIEQLMSVITQAQSVKETDDQFQESWKDQLQHHSGQRPNEDHGI